MIIHHFTATELFTLPPGYRWDQHDDARFVWLTRASDGARRLARLSTVTEMRGLSDVREYVETLFSVDPVGEACEACGGIGRHYAPCR